MSISASDHVLFGEVRPHDADPGLRSRPHAHWPGQLAGRLLHPVLAFVCIVQPYSWWPLVRWTGKRELVEGHSAITPGLPLPVLEVRDQFLGEGQVWCVAVDVGEISGCHGAMMPCHQALSSSMALRAWPQASLYEPAIPRREPPLA